MNTKDYTNHPEKYPHKAINKTSGECVVYGVASKNGNKVFRVIAPSAGSIVTYDQPDFEHYFNRAG